MEVVVVCASGIKQIYIYSAGGAREQYEDFFNYIH